LNWVEQWWRVSKSNKPILELLDNTDGYNKTLLDLGCGRGVLSELAIEKGFNVTSIDNGNTPYEKNIKMDAKELNGYWDYIIASGYPPSQLPKKVKCKNFIYTTSRNDFQKMYEGDLYILDNIYIRTNIKPMKNWKKINHQDKVKHL